MKIVRVEAQPVSVPLKEPFRIALESIPVAENVFVKVYTDDGLIGYGEAAPFKMVTGETQQSILTAVKHLEQAILGLDPMRVALVSEMMDRRMANNNGAKAALVSAIYDLAARHCRIPLYQLLGGYRDRVKTDITVTIKDSAAMAEDARKAVAQGFSVLKIKVGISPDEDIERVARIREAVGPGIKIRLDANQGWNVREAIRSLRVLEEFDVELVEQPVPAGDIEGLRQVRSSVNIPVMADESVFSPADALRVIKEGAVDYINIKLVKSGGIYKALQINALAEAAGIECMVGQMIETRLGATAAAHLAAACKNITRIDLDTPYFLSEDPVVGGVTYDGEEIILGDAAGLGVSV